MTLGGNLDVLAVNSEKQNCFPALLDRNGGKVQA